MSNSAKDKQMSKRAQLVEFVTIKMSYYMRRGNKDVNQLFTNIVSTLPAHLQDEIDRLDDAGRKWTRFKNECLKKAKEMA